ncbi:hypothetical protein [Winogradskyella sp. SYSU M77433]|uniref:hypothetical protein n=1 Tax=Winogradskyella sp. SYSU M77433 TaxID=3042722 RepID=UPI00247FBDEA|nr:hypothetical protein [Winogradskyella sp. SYSU M77433]MDH7914360.1 hypothetical protein [Winogradskyella sp. SYSU M77433]
MKKFKALLGTLITLTILSCSSDSNDSESNDPIVGEWFYIKLVEINNNTTYESFPDNCELQTSQVFNSNGNYSFMFYGIPENSSNCEVLNESISGDWGILNNNYDINYIYQDNITNEQFDSNEYIEYQSREIFIQNDTLNIRYNFSDGHSSNSQFVK